MKKILSIIFILFVLFIIGCGKEETKDLETITTEAYDIDESEIIENTEGGEVIEEEKENITTVRLCHDTDNGVIRWVNGSVFGFYDNAERFEFKDYCFDNNILIEYYCEDEMPQNRTFVCKNGCADNHCT